MSNIHTREQQLVKLHAKRQSQLASESVIVEFSVSNDILPLGADRLFDWPGQYPGWHGIIADLVRHLAAGEHSMLSGFVVVGDALATHADNALLAREFELILDASDRTSLTCCVCGACRGQQPLSVARMSCDIAAVDLMIRHDPEAAQARGWHSVI